MSNVVFPRLSQITERRQEIVDLIQQEFISNGDGGNGCTWFMSGGTSSRAYADVYRRMWEASGHAARVCTLTKAPFIGEAERICDEMLSDVPPKLLIYVGGQTVGDVAKYAVTLFNERCHRNGLNDSHLSFGGIITALSNDGVYSSGASLRDHSGLPVSKPCQAPAFILGHELTLLRQPYQLKCACVGDMLVKASSLWDYRYSCRVLEKQPNDFAADLTESSFQPFLDRAGHLESDYLHTRASIRDLFRAIQLSGLAIQIQGNTQTCSGSEHVGQKWLEEFFIEFNSIAGHDALPVHGIAVIPMAIITSYLQGQAHVGEQMKVISQTLNIPYLDFMLTLFPRDFVRSLLTACLAMGVGYRCPRYVASQFFPDVSPSSEERTTVLDEPEHTLLPAKVAAAIEDARLLDDCHQAAGSDSSARVQMGERALHKTRVRAWTRLKRLLQEKVPAHNAEHVAERLRPLFLS